jgi:paraquat-inducible protein A
MNFQERMLAAVFFRSRTRAAAFALSAAIMLVPANFLPVIHLDSPGESRTDTIFSSIVGLCEQGMWPLGAIVFTASFLVPLLKLAGLGWLIFVTRRPVEEHARGLTRLYALLDFIGRWSMLDVFLVSFLTGAVRFGAFATVEPRPGIIAFAAAVVLTMLATDAFDPHVLWLGPGRSIGEETP